MAEIGDVSFNLKKIINSGFFPLSHLLIPKNFLFLCAKNKKLKTDQQENKRATQ